MCDHRSRFILCDQHQVLRTKLEESCLGSLFKKSISGARKYCKFVKKPLMETVYQISTTDHMVYSPVAGTYSAICTNQSHFSVFIQVGNNRVSLPPGCSVQLESNILSSDFDIRVTPDPIQTIWTWDPLSFPFSSFHDVERADQQIRALHQDLKELEHSVFNNQTWDHHLQRTLSSPTSYPWYWYLTLAMLGIFVCVSSICYLWKCTNFCLCCHRILALYYQAPPLPSVHFQAAPPPVYQSEPASGAAVSILCSHKAALASCPICAPRYKFNP